MLRGGLQLLGGWVSGPYIRARLGLATVLVVVFYGVSLFRSSGPVYSQEQILDAIRMTESSGLENPRDGDGGRAIGPYQIHRIYWVDSGVPGDYQDCRRRDYAERVVRAYMRRWVPDAWRAGDAEVIARTHNGGPRGRHKRATDGYWRRVQTALSASIDVR